MLKFVTFLIAFLVLANRLYSQNKTVRGRVVDENLEALPSALIVSNDTVEFGRTDVDGLFQINIPVSTKTLIFRYAGIEPATIELSDTCNEAEIIMMFSRTYDLKPLVTVNRIRMKRFKKLPALHKKLFAEGVFKTDKVCYKQWFIPL